jgi:ABC-type proline/glycine betaine transport system ATPase subunit
VVMNAGRVVQTGTPADVDRRPSEEFVATRVRLVGLPDRRPPVASRRELREADAARLGGLAPTPSTSPEARTA